TNSRVWKDQRECNWTLRLVQRVCDGEEIERFTDDRSCGMEEEAGCACSCTHAAGSTAAVEFKELNILARIAVGDRLHVPGGILSAGGNEPSARGALGWLADGGV